MKPIQLISPVDGRVYAERTPLSPTEALAVVARAKAAQKPWAARPLEERIALVKAGVAKLNTMTDVVVEEIAWQMGRPTRYGGEGTARVVYFALLISHVVLAAISLPFILFTFIAAWTNRFTVHRRLARWVYPMWLYVAVTGPICYLMLRPYYGG